MFLLGVLALAPSFPYLAAPAGREYARVVPNGTTILPNGRFLTPLGKRLYTQTDLWNVVVSQDEKTVVGFDDEGLTIHEGGERKRLKLPKTAPAGVFSPDGTKLIMSTGDTAGLAIIDRATWKVEQQIPTGENGYLNDLIVTPDGKTVYAVDVATQELVTIDLAGAKVLSRVKAGRQPYAIAFSADQKSVLVANIGVFDYTAVPKPEAGKGHPAGLQYPPFGYPSKEATEGVYREGRQIAGLGDPRVPDSQSIYQYSITDPAKPKKIAFAKSGILIHAPADGGKSVGASAPNALLVYGKRLYVSNANNDTISVFDTSSLKNVQTYKITPMPEVKNLRGVIPSGMAISPDGTRLYVCESGLNAIGVIETKTGKTLGHIPSGWFPMQVRISKDGKTLNVATQKGIGRGPQGAKQPRAQDDERFGLTAMPGMVQQLTIPADAEMAKYTKQVLTNNGLVVRTARPTQKVMPLLPGTASKEIKHVVFITKENHTFDGIFGGLKGAKGEPDYAEYGMNGWIEEKGRATRLPIMPNHIRLAEQFGISDNFYMEPQASGDGHRWLVGVYPSLWTTRVYYAGWNFKADDKTKGRMVSFGSDGSQIPEDYLENGSLWEHLHRAGISFRNYGEGYELPNSLELDPNSKTGTNYVVNHPMPKILFENTCFEFPAYNNSIPDIARADWFEEDIEKNFRAKKKPLPKFMNIAICNDHGSGARPDRGYPYVCSYMADNDLALGRIVDYLSHTPEWKNMVIFVTQDDSGGDDDHVDRHRSFVMAIGPYVKRGYVSNDHTSIMSIIRSIYLLFGLGPNNMFDAVATPLDDMFTDKPNFAPYNHVPVDPRVFKPEETFDPSDPQFKRRRSEKLMKMDDPKFVEWLRNRSKN